ncbi:MAG: molybdenum cofactor guanylyltransferase [Actinomyces sp.]|nr:MAG: molybdenum cofactor guanylyltransferase [Actinomyces sp.]
MPVGDVPFSAAVLAGGASRRMGRDKALIELDGLLLVERALVSLAAAGAREVFVVGGDRSRLAARGHRVVADIHPGQGPLGGIITALATSRHPVTAVLACDLVDPSPVPVTSLLGALGTSQVAVPHVEGRDEWLHAVWRREAREPLEAAFAGGARAVRTAGEVLAVTRLCDADPCWFADADTPGELAASLGARTPPGRRRAPDAARR